MNGLDLLIGVVVVAAIAAILRWARRMDALEDRLVEKALEVRRQETIRRTLCGLVDVTPDGTLISPRGVELQLHDGWSDTDALDVLATIEAL